MEMEIRPTPREVDSNVMNPVRFIVILALLGIASLAGGFYLKEIGLGSIGFALLVTAVFLEWGRRAYNRKEPNGQLQKEEL